MKDDIILKAQGVPINVRKYNLPLAFTLKAKDVPIKIGRY